MRDGNWTFEEPKVHFSYIYMWEMHFLGQKNVSDFTKRSFFVYIYVGNAFWGGQQKSSFSQKVHFSYIYMLETHFSKCHKNVTRPQIFTFRIYICSKCIF